MAVRPGKPVRSFEKKQIPQRVAFDVMCFDDKTDKKGGICVQGDVFLVRQLFVIKEGKPVPVAKEV